MRSTPSVLGTLLAFLAALKATPASPVPARPEARRRPRPEVYAPYGPITSDVHWEAKLKAAPVVVVVFSANTSASGGEQRAIDESLEQRAALRRASDRYEKRVGCSWARAGSRRSTRWSRKATTSTSRSSAWTTAVRSSCP